jgi:hypothetical protein
MYVKLSIKNILPYYLNEIITSLSNYTLFLSKYKDQQDELRHTVTKF